MLDEERVIKQKLDFTNNYYGYWHNGKTITSLDEIYSPKCLTCDACCCRRFPCYCLPCDFGGNLHDPAYIKMVLSVGPIVVSPSFLEKPDFYVLRPRHIKEKNKVINKKPIFSKPCVFLGENGCILPKELRPTEGLLYLCGRGQSAYEELSIYDIHKAWEPFQPDLEPFYEDCLKGQIPAKTVITEEDIKTLRKYIMFPYQI